MSAYATSAVSIGELERPNNFVCCRRHGGRGSTRDSRWCSLGPYLRQTSHERAKIPDCWGCGL